jgi:FAD/FMN-containing dehydrogenase
MQEEIKKFFKGDVENSDEVLIKYSHDASVLEVRPEIVLFPKDSEDVKNLVKWVNENKNSFPNLAITPRSAGTCMSGGAIGESIIIDFTRYMNKLINFEGEIIHQNNILESSPSETKGQGTHDSANTILENNFSDPQYSKSSFEKKNLNDSSAFALGDIRQGTHDASNPLNFSSITVEPGMYYRDFEKITLEKGLILPCYTASKNINAVGGMYGNNSAGERTLVYGKTENYVVEAKVVFADGNLYTVKPLSKKELENKILQNDFEGNIYKNIYNLILENKEEILKAKPNVSKNSAGYTFWNVVDFAGVRGEGNYFDLNKLLVGSQGTLGITTEITFSLVKENTQRKLLVVFLRDLKVLPSIVNDILKYKPETLESYDDKTFLLVLKYIWDFIKLLGLKNLFKLIFSFGPEMLMTLRNGFPKLILLIEFAGDDEKEVSDKARVLYEELKKNKKIGVHLTRDEFEAKKYWTIRHEAFNLIRYHLKKVKSKPFIDDVVVRPEKLPEFFPAIYGILNEYKKDMTFAIGGHVGDGNLHIYTLLDPKNKKLVSIIREVSEKVYDLVAKLGGSNTAEHNDGMIRTIFLPKMFNPKVISLFTETKEIFDDKYIFNPGKKVLGPKSGALGTQDFIDKHISRS